MGVEFCLMLFVNHIACDFPIYDQCCELPFFLYSVTFVNFIDFSLISLTFFKIFNLIFFQTFSKC